MIQKPKTVKKNKEEQLETEEEIAQIHDKKIMFEKVYYLVHIKDNQQKTWKSETQLKKNPTFQKQQIKYELILKGKQILHTKNSQSPLPRQSNQISLEKQTKTPEFSPQPKKIRIDKQKIKQAPPVIKQQMSLDSFVGKTTKTETLTVNTKQKQEQSKQESKKPIMNETTKQQLPVTKVNPIWVQKIKSISRVKGYQLKNGQILYEVEASDKNGQNFFIPPQPSDVIMKFDPTKLASFLQDCMLRGYALQTKSM